MNAITLISFISLLGYTVGAAALLIILSVFNGFENLFTKMYSNFDADFQILPKSGKSILIKDLPINEIKELGWVKGSTFVWEENALLRYNGKQTIATIKAVDQNYLQINPLDTHIIRGQLLLSNGDTSFALVGEGIGYQLGIDPDDQFKYLGIYIPKKGKVDLMDPDGAFAHGVVFPIGVFSIQEEVNNKYILLPISFVFNQLEDSTLISMVELRMKPGNELATCKESLMNLLGEKFEIKDRFEQRESFFKVMQSEKSISYFILVFILLIAAFNTVGSLYMLVIEKRDDLRVLANMGLTPNATALIFTFQSLLIATSGGLVGLLLGYLICTGQQEFQWVALQTNGDSVLSAYPVMVKNLDVVKVFFTLLAMGFLTSLYPAWKAKELVKGI